MEKFIVSNYHLSLTNLKNVIENYYLPIMSIINAYSLICDKATKQYLIMIITYFIIK